MNKVIQGAHEALAIARGELAESEYAVHGPENVDVRQIREKLGMTQVTFANAFGFKLATLKLWEQRKRTPEDPARSYLLVIDRNPETVRQALQRKSS